MKVTELKKQLQTYDQKELIQLIADLYKMNKEVQTYLSVQFMGEEVTDELFERKAKIIKDEFFPDRGFAKMRLTVAKKAITDYKKLTGNEFNTTSLMLYYVEIGVAFTMTYGDIDEAFYNSMLSMYEKVVNLCYKKDAYYQRFANRMERAVINAEGVGWGFHDTLSDWFYELKYQKEEEE